MSLSMSRDGEVPIQMEWLQHDITVKILLFSSIKEYLSPWST